MDLQERSDQRERRDLRVDLVLMENKDPRDTRDLLDPLDHQVMVPKDLSFTEEEMTLTTFRRSRGYVTDTESVC